MYKYVVSVVSVLCIVTVGHCEEVSLPLISQQQMRQLHFYSNCPRPATVDCFMVSVSSMGSESFIGEESSASHKLYICESPGIDVSKITIQYRDPQSKVYAEIKPTKTNDFEEDIVPFSGVVKITLEEPFEQIEINIMNANNVPIKIIYDL